VWVERWSGVFRWDNYLEKGILAGNNDLVVRRVDLAFSVRNISV
jgi:hypothetical protein